MKYCLNEAERAAIADALDIAFETAEAMQDWSHPVEVVDRLKEVFGVAQPPGPLWRTDPFTEEDRANMLDMVMEEVRDSVKSFAEDSLDDITDIAELVSYADMDPQVTAELLNYIFIDHCCIEDYESGEHQQHVDAAAFMRRMGLVNAEGSLTEVGHRYLQEYK